MWKAVLAGTTSLMIAGSSLVYAQQQPGAPAAAAPGGATAPAAPGGAASTPEQRATEWANHVKALAEARLGTLKSELKLTPEQEKNWPALHTALQDLAKYYVDQETPPRPPTSAPGATAPERKPADPAVELRQRADELMKFAGVLKRLADAFAPFYSSLDDGQKQRFAMHAPPILHEHMGGDMDDDDHDDGPGPNMRGDLGIGGQYGSGPQMRRPGMSEPGMGGMYGPDMGYGERGPGMRGPGMYGGDMGPGMRGPGMGGPDMGYGMPRPGMGSPDMGYGMPRPGMGSPDMGYGMPRPGMGGPGMYGDESPGMRPPGVRPPGVGGPGMMGAPMTGYGSSYPGSLDGAEPPRGGMAPYGGPQAGLAPGAEANQADDDDDDDDDDANAMGGPVQE
jgi:hypothetical protein